MLPKISMEKSAFDENRAACFLQSLGLIPERYTKSHRQQKTPDFQVSGPTDIFFLCEVKSVLTAIGPNGILHSTIFNNLTENIHIAVKQFCAVNSTHSVPNVLLWVSHNCQINVHTFLDLMRGRITIGQTLIADLTKFRKGRIVREINEIDLHIWLESDDTPQFVFTEGFRHLQPQLRKVFKID